jgi:hypothetical protein
VIGAGSHTRPGTSTTVNGTGRNEWRDFERNANLKRVTQVPYLYLVATLEARRMAQLTWAHPQRLQLRSTTSSKPILPS